MSAQELFIKILRFELRETELDDSIKAQLSHDAIESVYSLAAFHDVVHIVSSALYKSGVLSDANLLSKIKKEEMIAAYRHEQNKYTFDQICGIFEELHIRYVPLKGAVVRQYYPREDMRTSCDIDILIEEENLGRAIQALTSKGFKSVERNYHDVSLISTNNVHLELHFSIEENRAALDKILKNAWSYVVPGQGCRCDLTSEFLMFYQLAHMYYHFVTGGCGIRSLMDIWIMKTKMGLSYLQAKPMLEEAGICMFAAEMSNLADICFGGGQPNDISDALIAYILSGGTFGTQDNKLSIESMKGGALAYAIRRIFLPYKTMVYYYPMLKRSPFLLPLFYIVRLSKMFSKGKAWVFVEEMKGFRTLTDMNTMQIKHIWKRLGIK